MDLNSASTWTVIMWFRLIRTNKRAMCTEWHSWNWNFYPMVKAILWCIAMDTNRLIPFTWIETMITYLSTTLITARFNRHCVCSNLLSLDTSLQNNAIELNELLFKCFSPSHVPFLFNFFSLFHSFIKWIISVMNSFFLIRSHGKCN